MLTGDLVRVKLAKERVVPLYIDRNVSRWIEAAESLLLLFREGIGMTRGEIEETRSTPFLAAAVRRPRFIAGWPRFSRIAPSLRWWPTLRPIVIREKVFTAAADYRRQMRSNPGIGSRPSRGHFAATKYSNSRGPGTRTIDARGRLEVLPLRRPARREPAAVVRRHAGPVADRPL